MGSDSGLVGSLHRDINPGIYVTMCGGLRLRGRTLRRVLRWSSAHAQGCAVMFGLDSGFVQGFFQILGVMILLSMWAGVLRPTWGWTALVLLVALIFGPALIAIAMFATAGLFVLIRHVERAKPGAGEGKPDGGKADPDG